MRPFRVGDVFCGNHSGLIAEVSWVDPHDHFRAVVNGTDFVDETVYASQFLSHWTLINEGPALTREG
jgi:hypothetical protein